MCLYSVALCCMVFYFMSLTVNVEYRFRSFLNCGFCYFGSFLCGVKHIYGAVNPLRGDMCSNYIHLNGQNSHACALTGCRLHDSCT